MAKARILVVEDDKHIAKLIAYNLQKAEYDCFCVNSGEEALSYLQKEAADLIVLDLMLPKMDGFEVCRTLKQDSRLKAIPVLMLTARGEEVDRVVGLELGADDYMVKPFSPRELALRIKAILRRGHPEPSCKELLAVNDLVVDVPRHTVAVKGKKVELTAMEFKLLVTLIERRGRVQKREVLLSDVWGIYTEIDTRTIDTHIKRVREKLGKAGKMILTVRGLGYKFSDSDEA